MRRLLAALISALPALAACDAAPQPGPVPPAREHVVVLHGLARTERSMAPLAERLEAAGYAVHNVHYPSTEADPDALPAVIDREVRACCTTAPAMHFVTHSLGGILVRAYLAEHRPANLGRVVMLAPPNKGSEIVDTIGDTALFRWAFGPTATELGTAQSSLPNRLPPPDYDVGIIAGARTVNPVGSAVIPDADDGAVSIDSARLEGMADFIALPYSHTFIMRAPEAAEQTAHFLRHGRFAHRPEASTARSPVAN